jgi:hypothetical protein
MAIASAGELGEGRVPWLIGPVCETGPATYRNWRKRLNPFYPSNPLSSTGKRPRMAR